MRFLYSPNCCCNCYICKDEFNRSDTSDAATALGTCLEEYGTLGTLEIASNKLKIAGTDSGVAFLESGDYLAVRAAVALPTHTGSEETKLRFLFGYTDEDNHFFWELHYKIESSTFYGFLTLNSRIAGVETLIEDEFFNGTIASGIYNRMDSITGHYRWFYDAVSGWCSFEMLSSTNTTTSLLNGSWGNAWHKLGSTIGNRMGIGFGDVCDHYATIDYASLYVPTQNEQVEVGHPENARCPDIIIGLGCNVQLCVPADEATITLAGIGTGSCAGAGLNATYVLSLADQNMVVTYRDVFANRRKGGVLYRYTLPSAICGVKYLDFWLDSSLSSEPFSFLMLVDASGNYLTQYQFSTNTCPTCGGSDVVSSTLNNNFFPSPTYSTSGSTATVER